MNASWVRYLPRQLQSHLDGRAALQAVVANSSWLLFDRLIRMALALFVGAWVARYLGPALFGELAYVVAYVSFFHALASLGADGIIVRDIAREPDASAQVLGTAFALRLMAGFVCWFAAVGGMAVMNGIDHPSVALTALAAGVVVFQAADTIDMWFQSQTQSRRTVVAKMVACLLSNGAKVGLILFGAPLIAFAAVIAIDAMLAALALAVAYRYFSTQGRWEALSKRAKQLLRESWPFMLSGISIAVYMRVDQIMLKELVGERELGIYAAALPLSQIWQIVPITLAVSIAPFIARKKIEGEVAYMQSLAKTFRLFAVLGLIVSVGTALLSGILVELLYGVAYSGTALVLAIHVFTNIFISLGVAQGLWLINEGYGHIGLYRTLIGAVVCVAGNLTFIPTGGALAAACVAVVAQFCSTVASNLVFAPKIFKMQLIAMLPKH